MNAINETGHELAEAGLKKAGGNVARRLFSRIPVAGVALDVGSELLGSNDAVREAENNGDFTRAAALREGKFAAAAGEVAAGAGIYGAAVGIAAVGGPPGWVAGLVLAAGYFGWTMLGGKSAGQFAKDKYVSMRTGESQAEYEARIAKNGAAAQMEQAVGVSGLMEEATSPEAVRRNVERILVGMQTEGPNERTLASLDMLAPQLDALSQNPDAWRRAFGNVTPEELDESLFGLSFSRETAKAFGNRLGISEDVKGETLAYLSEARKAAGLTAIASNEFDFGAEMARRTALRDNPELAAAAREAGTALARASEEASSTPALAATSTNTRRNEQPAEMRLS